MQTPTQQLQKWIPYQSWPYPKDLAKSIPQMSQQQLFLNLIQINLIAYYNEDVLEMLNYKMTQTSFYLRNRHVLENVVNVKGREKELNQKIKAICQKWDQLYVNGAQFIPNSHAKEPISQILEPKEPKSQAQSQPQEPKSDTEKHIKQRQLQHYNLKSLQQQNLDIQQCSPKPPTQINQNLKLFKSNKSKQHRAKFIMRREDFILALSQISDKLYQIKQGKNQEQVNQNKQKVFVEQIEEINRKIEEQEEIKSTSSVEELQQPIQLCDLGQMKKAQSVNNDKLQQIYTQNLQSTKSSINRYPKSINFALSRGYSLFFKDQYHQVSQIMLSNSCFIKTKNRSPLKLDFGFGSFIYKNDDQLSHQLIAMELIKYLNKVFGKEYIKEYDIIPEIKGALYEFVDQAVTVAHVKREHKDLIQYLKTVSQRSNVSYDTLVRRFAESYAGYCIAQFLLQIKDRNNANLMIREDGTFFHIDLAFIFNAKPGGINFQSAPFKMTKEYLKLMGGFDSDHFKYFESLLIQLLTKLHQSKDQFLYKLQILGARNKEIRCFNAFDIDKYRKEKIVDKLDNVRQFVEDLIDRSYDSWNTRKPMEYLCDMQFTEGHVFCSTVEHPLRYLLRYVL